MSACATVGTGSVHLLVAQACVLYSLLRDRPFSSIDDIIAKHVESPGTRAYVRSEAEELFGQFRNVQIDTVVTPYDVRYGRGRYLPAWVLRVIPDSLGWFMVVRGQKPS